MYKIGQFSKITKISARMLRYYDKENLLKPSFIGDNGYRFYTDEDYNIISKIKKLRRYHFSYDEIKIILNNNEENDKDIYLNKLEELKSNVDEYEILISELEQMNNLKNKNSIINNYDISICEKKSFDAICKRKVIKCDEIDLFLEKNLYKIMRKEVCTLGHYFIMFCNNEELTEDMCEIEFYQPMSKIKEVKEFEIKHIEKDTYISTIHYGRYDELYNAYSALYKWATCNKFIIKGNFIEKYFVDSYLTSSSEEFITEISVSVSKL